MEATKRYSTFSKRLRSMLSVDLRRMLTTSLFYIMLGICLVMPILILVMTTMMDGTVTVDPQTKVETVMEGFDNVWQILGSVSTESATMDMSLTGMCNINMLYFFVGVFTCLFISADFKSGYVKNLFTVRAKKTDYVISKSVVCILCGALMILAFFIGAMLGGAITGLSFDTGVAGAYGVIMCLLSKMLLVSIFVPISLLVSVIAKQRVWLSILLSLGVGMLLFNIVPTVSPLDSTILNVALSLVGGALLSIGIGAVSNLILRRTSLI